MSAVEEAGVVLQFRLVRARGLSNRESRVIRFGIYNYILARKILYLFYCRIIDPHFFIVYRVINNRASMCITIVHLCAMCLEGQQGEL